MYIKLYILTEGLKYYVEAVLGIFRYAFGYEKKVDKKTK